MALRELRPKAIQALEESLGSDDERVRLNAARRCSNGAMGSRFKHCGIKKSSLSSSSGTMRPCWQRPVSCPMRTAAAQQAEE